MTNWRALSRDFRPGFVWTPPLDIMAANSRAKVIPRNHDIIKFKKSIKTLWTRKECYLWLFSMMMMMMMMMMNFFCGMVDRRKVFSLISSRDDCQRSSSPSRISDMPREGFEPAQNMSSDFDGWSCALVITATLRFIVHNMNKDITVARTNKRIADMSFV